MKHLSQQMIDSEIRKPHLQRYQKDLRAVLRRPGLTAEERGCFSRRLALSGKPKVYDPSETPRPGALNPGPMPPAGLEFDLESASADSLSTISHTRLYLYAQQEGLKVDPSDTKAQIIKTILESNEGGES